MAVMWPRKLPAEVLRNELRSAERKVYDRLASELDDSWTVFYSRPWLGLCAMAGSVAASILLVHIFLSPFERWRAQRARLHLA